MGVFSRELPNRNSGTTWKGVAGASTPSPTWSMSTGEALPTNLEPSRMCTIRRGSNPVSLAQVASAATGSSPITIFRKGLGVPLSGPLPSIATMPSWGGGAQIKDALLNALPMENILRPSVPCTRHHTEHVFHAEGNAGPVMSLDFRHGNQEIGLQHSAGEPEAYHPHVVR